MSRIDSIHHEKAIALHLMSFLLSVLLLTTATTQSECGNFDSYCKIFEMLHPFNLSYTKMYVIHCYMQHYYYC